MAEFQFNNAGFEPKKVLSLVKQFSPATTLNDILTALNNPNDPASETLLETIAVTSKLEIAQKELEKFLSESPQSQDSPAMQELENFMKEKVDMAFDRANKLEELYKKAEAAFKESHELHDKVIAMVETQIQKIEPEAQLNEIEKYLIRSTSPEAKEEFLKCFKRAERRDVSDKAEQIEKILFDSAPSARDTEAGQEGIRRVSLILASRSNVYDHIVKGE
jgi:hypothetical protein